MLFIASFLCLAMSSCTGDPKQQKSIDIIPIPNNLTRTSNEFRWKQGDEISIVSESSLQNENQYLKEILEKATGAKITDSDGAKRSIKLEMDSNLGEEAYTLSVKDKQITIKGGSAKGVFFGIQTLLQMLPSQVYAGNGLANGFSVEGVEIEDAPQFPYRGMHMDVSRNFAKKEDVMRFIDMMSHYKFNTFHWHLTDGAGWRIEIKKYPELTRKTAFRAQSTWKEFWNEGQRKFVDEGTPNSYGGYYTQEDIKEVVAYAAKRHINIIPEIEMPGHSEEVFVAYPELSCSGIPYKDSDYCAGNDQTFKFIEDVLTEVIDLFPSQYIHIGGDEAGKEAWKTCPKCKKRMTDENLQDLHELQSYFVKRVSDFLKTKNKKLIGWDEIIDGGLASDATVMLWRDQATAIKASEMGHDVIMTPGSHCYLDFYQGDPTTEPESIGGFLPLRKVYSFPVIPEGADPKHFIGGQGNLWAEYIPTFKHMEYMAFPRALAIAEVTWSKADNRNWDDFKKRLPNQLERFDLLGVNYHKPSYELEMFQNIDTINKTITVTLEHEQINPEIRYTTDGSIPTSESVLFTDSLVLANGIDFCASIMVDGVAKLPYKRNIGYHKAIGKKVIYNKPWTSYPAGGETALVDGLLGGFTYSDQMWQGFTSDMDIVIDFEEMTEIGSINARFMQLIGPGVYMPEFVEIAYSSDNKNYTTIAKIENDIPAEHDRLIFKDFGYSLKEKVNARYIQVKAKNQKGFLFTDEIVIN